MIKRKALLYAFDYVDSSRLNLQSSINDVHLMWSLLKSKYNLLSDDIMIVGKLDIRGKILPWRMRYYSVSIDSGDDCETEMNRFLDETSLTDVCQLLVYFSGHGTKDGMILFGSEDDQRKITDLIPERFLTDQTWIIADMCYSHLFTLPVASLGPSVFIPTSHDSPIIMSTKRGSIFTIGFVQTLMYNPDSFFQWLADEMYYTTRESTMPYADKVDNGAD